MRARKKSTMRDRKKSSFPIYVPPLLTDEALSNILDEFDGVVQVELGCGGEIENPCKSTLL
jgi:hypothetical protein